MSQAKQRKHHYFVKDTVHGFNCLICGLQGDIESMQAVRCGSKEDRLRELEAQKRSSVVAVENADQIASDLQLAEYLTALEAEQAELEQLYLMQQLEQEEESLRLLLGEALLDPGCHGHQAAGDDSDDGAGIGPMPDDDSPTTKVLPETWKTKTIRRWRSLTG